MVGGQEDGGDVRAPRQRDERVVGEAQQNQARAAEMNQPSQAALFRREQDDRKYVHLRYRILNCVRHDAMLIADYAAWLEAHALSIAGSGLAWNVSLEHEPGIPRWPDVLKVADGFRQDNLSAQNGPRGLIDRHGLRDLVSAASAAESFRSRWGSVRGAPVCNSQASPIAAPQVLQGTDNTCFGVSSLVFTTASCNVSSGEDVQYCSPQLFLGQGLGCHFGWGQGDLSNYEQK